MIIIVSAKVGNLRRNERAYKISLSTLSAALFCGFFLVYFLKFPALASRSVSSALNVCAKGLIPSLFPFIVLIGIINETGLSEKTAQIFGKPLSMLFGISNTSASAIIAGAVGGFPMGALCVKRLYEANAIEKSEAERLVGIANNASPAFCISAVGLTLFGDVDFGIKLYLCQLAAAVFIGILTRDRQHKASLYRPQKGGQSFMKAFTASVSGGGLTMFKICSYTLFFAVVGDAICMICDLTLGTVASSVCAAFCELTLGARKAAEIGLPLSKALCAFTVGFSGICVHMQVADILSDTGISLKFYIKSKLLQGILSAIFILMLG